MDYMTTKDAAAKWNISDRRVRVLCSEGRIAGVIESNGTYLIPCDAEKPADKRFRAHGAARMAAYEYDMYGRPVHPSAVCEDGEQYGSRAFRPVLFLKWEDHVIAQIGEDYSVFFSAPLFNSTVEAYTHGSRHWTRAEFEEFLRGRIVSSGRRDIEKILFRCGLSSYNTIKIGIATKAVNAGDLIWITDDPGEKLQDAVSAVFNSIFLQRIDAEGDSVDTPEGYNIKRYGVMEGRYGIYKKRISPVTCDAESELAVFGIARLMGIPCCPAVRVDADTVFSQFEYDFGREYIVHMRRLFEAAGARGMTRSGNEYLDLLALRPQYQADIVRMIALDFVTRQDDRHLSNIAVRLSDKGESFYPLYDNGRSLFYEDTEETALRACEDVRLFSTAFGPSGTYYDHVKDISSGGICFRKLMDLDISEADIRKVLRDSGFRGYRFDAALSWISQTLDVLRELDMYM